MSKKQHTRKRYSLKNAMAWTWGFTKVIVSLLTVLYFIIMIYCGFVIRFGMSKLSMVTYLDTFMTEINETFRLIVGANVIKATIENVFKYNDFGGKVKSCNKNDRTSIDNESTSDDITEDLYTSTGSISDGLQ